MATHIKKKIVGFSISTLPDINNRIPFEYCKNAIKLQQI